jgi:hypothetical protein
MTTRQSRSVGQGARKLLNELQAIVDQETQSAYCYGERLVMLEVFHDFVHHRLLEHTDRYVGLNGSNLHGIPWRLLGFRARHQLLPVTVGTTIAGRPPQRSVRAELPHTAPTSDEWRRNARQDKDAGCEREVSIVRRSGGCASSMVGCADCDAQAWHATGCTAGRGSAVMPAGFRGRHGNGSSRRRHLSAILRQR